MQSSSALILDNAPEQFPQVNPKDADPVNQVSYTLVEQALDEIKGFISILYGSCMRFYSTLLVYSELEEMREDLIERLTTMLFYNDNLTQLVLQLCKISTQES